MVGCYPIGFGPAWLSAELFRLPVGRVCSAMNRSLQEQVSGSVAKRLQQDCCQAADESVNFWLLWFIWALLIRSSYRYWPLLVAMVVEGEKHDF